MSKSVKHQKAINLAAFNQTQTQASPLLSFILNHLILCILVALALITGFLQLILLLPGGLYVAGIIMIGFGMWVNFILVNSNKKKKPNLILNAFVRDNGFLLTDLINQKSEAVIFQAGNREHQSYNGFSGKLYSFPFLIYQHVFSKGSGKSKTRHHYIVTEISLPKMLPHIFIDNRGNDSFFNPEVLTSFNDSQLVKLEGDFPKSFNVYSVTGHHIALLTLLNPGFMNSLLNFNDKFELELLDDKAFIYLSDAYVYTEQSIMRVFSAVEFVTLELQKQLDSFSFDVDDKRPSKLQKSKLKKFLSWR